MNDRVTVPCGLRTAVGSDRRRRKRSKRRIKTRRKVIDGERERIWRVRKKGARGRNGNQVGNIKRRIMKKDL